MCGITAALAAAAVGGVAVDSCVAADVPASVGAPNIVFILTDDLGIDDLACYGRREHHTPHLDRLATQGMRFTSAYCAQPICSASRAAIVTGKTPARLHLTTYLPGRPDCPSQMLLHPIINQQLPLEELTFAERLKAAGYVSACIGKWHLGGKGFGPAEQGFDVVFAGRANTTPSATEGGKGEYELTAHAMEFIEQNRDKRFFLHLCHNTPHIPYAARQDLVEKNAGAFDPVYAGVLEAMDDTVGLLLKKLDELGLADNTLVVFTSDNGGLHVPEGPHIKITDNAPDRAGKGFVYEGGLRIPLIVRWPGHVPAGQVVDTPVVNTDWTPTFLELAHLPPVAGLDGQSMVGILQGGKPASERTLCWHFPHYTNQGSQPAGAVRQGDWKLIEHYEDTRLELYNLAQDIGETTNLANQQRERAERMRAALAAWRVAVGAQTNTPNPQFDPVLHRKLYQDVEPSQYHPLRADAAELNRMIEWRRLMNDVLPKRAKAKKDAADAPRGKGPQGG